MNEPCVHHWDIESARADTGGISPGICINCGEQKEFLNYVRGAGVFDYRNKERKKTAGRPRKKSVGRPEDDNRGITV